MNIEIKVTIAIILISVIGFMVADTVGAFYHEGIPRTHKGSIQYVDHRYNKWCGYDWTDVEILTYAGDTHHARFWGHIDFDLGKTYKIHTVKEYKFFLNNGWVGYERIVELTEVV